MPGARTKAGVTCSDCHDPHSLELKRDGDEVCAQSHPVSRFAAPAHHHHPADSAGASCRGCHMPERTYMVVDDRAEHSLRIPRPDLTIEIESANACFSQTLIERWPDDPQANALARALGL